MGSPTVPGGTLEIGSVLPIRLPDTFKVQIATRRATSPASCAAPMHLLSCRVPAPPENVIVRRNLMVPRRFSPSNSAAEIAEKRVLYFDAGAAEVWICNRDGSFAFFSAPDHQLPHSVICPLFPGRNLVSRSRD